MKETFRQSMTWLHTWTGLLVGWVLFFVFLTGTLGYVNDEVDRWMRPDQAMAAVPIPAADMMRLAERRLRETARGAEQWQISLPVGRGAVDLAVGWRIAGKAAREILDPRTGLPVERTAARTGGGATLYVMHYALHYVPYEWGIRIVGLCTMLMLISILTGVVAHKRIFADFFTFRPGKGQRSWLDGHTLLAVTALPFHAMITWSGLVFFVFTYMPIAIDTLYPDGAARDRFYVEAFGTDHTVRDAPGAVASMVSPASLLGQVHDRWGDRALPFVVIIDNPERDNARIAFYAERKDSVDRTRVTLRFDGATGVPIESDVAQTSPGRFNGILLGLHEGRFAGTALRFLYVLAGLVGTAMIGTGLVLWTAKRKSKLKATDRPHLGVRLVDVLNLGTIVGLPIGIAAYFWANRLLPLDMPGRAGWEVHVMFIVWGATFLYALARPLDRAWIELCALAAAASVLLPLLNALTTTRHLGVSIPAGDWVFAGFDLSAVAVGLFFAAVASAMVRKQETA